MHRRPRRHYRSAWVCWASSCLSTRSASLVSSCSSAGSRVDSCLTCSPSASGIGGSASDCVNCLLRLMSFCPCWNGGQRIVSIGHDHWQRSWLHECHCPFLAYLLYMYPAMSALACPIFYFLSLDSSLSPHWLVVTLGGTVHAR